MERELYRRLPPLSPAEQALWGLSAGSTRAASMSIAALPKLHARSPGGSAGDRAEIAEITGGAVTSIDQVARLLPWLQRAGLHHGETRPQDDREATARTDELVARVRRVLELRLGGAQAAVKKIDALLARAGDDDRVRGAFRYHGAATGRWSGEGFQPQNLKRPTVERSRRRDRCGRDRRLSSM